MTAIAEPTRRTRSGGSQPRRAPLKNVPEALIYEVWDGKPIYYKGYRDVVAGKKTAAEIMSCSDFQGVLVSLLNFHLGNLIDRKTYLLATNEIGLHLQLNDNLANDVVIYEKAKLGKLKGKFFDIPPKVAIEVDIKADTTDFADGADGYVMRKAQKLLDFGVEKVVWIITGMQRVYVIDRNDPTWYVVDWGQDITVLDGCTINIKRLLDEEEIEY
jgi:hypothetical protein